MNIPNTLANQVLQTYPEFAKYDTGDGCTVPKKRRVKLCEKLRRYGLWWDESEEKQ